jgi:hypothetical protein
LPDSCLLLLVPELSMHNTMLQKQWQEQQQTCMLLKYKQAVKVQVALWQTVLMAASHDCHQNYRIILSS